MGFPDSKNILAIKNNGIKHYFCNKDKSLCFKKINLALTTVKI